jgi:hypothetical protein
METIMSKIIRSRETDMSLYDRRRMMLATLAAVGCGTVAAWGNGVAPRLRVRAQEKLCDVPADYCGFSVEKSQLSDIFYFCPETIGLVALFKRLSPHGVLRIGGNSSEFCWWRDAPDAAAPPVHLHGQGRADNWMPQRFTAVEPAAAEALRGFLDACGWRCIWGLNFGTGSPQRNAVEAAYVARTLGPRLMYFQIGNEPDFYREPNTLLRPADWGFSDYMSEWTATAKAILAKVPDARFGGPDVGANVEWVVRFARDARTRIGNSLVALSGHYYACGPPEAAHVNIANLLRPNFAAAIRMKSVTPAIAAAGVGYRMTEGNSCYRGGKAGMSNAFASALWAGDYMLDMAAHGCRGVNLHCGSGATIAASLGGKLPGVRNEADRIAAEAGAFYSPIAGSREAGFDARPIFYGMMLAERLAGATMVACDFDTAGANATAYAARTGRELRLVLINKEATRDIRVQIDLTGEADRRGPVWRLKAPGLDAREKVTFAGSPVGHGNAAWRPRDTEVGQAQRGALVLTVPRASALAWTGQAGLR